MFAYVHVQLVERSSDISIHLIDTLLVFVPLSLKKKKFLKDLCIFYLKRISIFVSNNTRLASFFTSTCMKINKFSVVSELEDVFSKLLLN